MDRNPDRGDPWRGRIDGAFRLGVIILSALIGAEMLLEASASPMPGTTLIFTLLVVLGIGVQVKIMQENS